MITIENSCNTAVVFADSLDSGAEGLIRSLCVSSIAVGSTIRIMPDVHAGKGCAIGTTMTIQDRVAPGLVGVDIGCGMTALKFRAKRLELQKLDKLLRERFLPDGLSERSHTGLRSRRNWKICAACGISRRIKPFVPLVRWAEVTTSSRWIRTMMEHFG